MEGLLGRATSTGAYIYPHIPSYMEVRPARTWMLNGTCMQISEAHEKSDLACAHQNKLRPCFRGTVTRPVGDMQLSKSAVLQGMQTVFHRTNSSQRLQVALHLHTAAVNKKRAAVSSYYVA